MQVVLTDDPRLHTCRLPAASFVVSVVFRLMNPLTAAAAAATTGRGGYDDDFPFLPDQKPSESMAEHASDSESELAYEACASPPGQWVVMLSASVCWVVSLIFRHN